MAYVDGLLSGGERILRRARQHWFIMVWNARWGIAAIVLALVGGVIKLFNLSDNGAPMFILGWLVLILLLAGLAMLAWSWIVYQNTDFVVTNRRIIQASGVINKRASDSSLEMINDAILTESIFGRIFGFGDLEVLTASEAGIDNLRMLTDAKEFKKAMLDAKQEYEVERTRQTSPPMRAPAPTLPPTPVATAPAVPPAAPPAPVPTRETDTPQEVADAVARLGELRDKGLVTPAEFEAKKQELLDRL
jgi:Bacterial PH domain/Short C-terminal domain